jgi:hypothetical protein
LAATRNAIPKQIREYGPELPAMRGPAMSFWSMAGDSTPQLADFFRGHCPE